MYHSALSTLVGMQKDSLEKWPLARSFLELELDQEPHRAKACCVRPINLCELAVSSTPKLLQ